MFTLNQVYKRSEIHDRFKGNRQNGISVPAGLDVIFIFTGSRGHSHGYRDEWENEHIFSYTGEGQEGDMEFARGNLQLRDHKELGKSVFLFEYVKKGYVKYVGEVEVFNWGYFSTHDNSGRLRRAIKFFFKRKEAVLPVSPYQLAYDAAMAAESAQLGYNFEPNYTERQSLVTSRVGQGAYRMSILHRWNYSCAVTKFSNPQVLIASHIHPWKDATDRQRLDPDNGILLSPDFDALFDRHLISFDEKGHIMIGKELDRYDATKLGLRGDEKVTTFTDNHQHYLEFHRTLLK